MKDDELKAHDPLLDQEDENALEDIEVEQVTQTGEVLSPEEAAMHTDTETALEADLDNEPTIEEEKKQDADRKHKNRESTSEKAKKSTKQSTSEKAKLAEEEHKKQFDPLRLRGKKYRTKASELDRNISYPLAEAIELVKKASYSKFDGAVEMHIKIKGEGTRGTVVLPHGNGKSRKVAVATDEVLEEIAAGKMNFDVLLATPAQMPKLAKFAKVLGPKGLMPSPKAGTVTEDIDKVKDEISGGRVEYRADKNGVVHLSVGKISFKNEQLEENIKAIQQVLISAKILGISLAPTMGPGVRVQI